MNKEVSRTRIFSPSRGSRHRVMPVTAASLDLDGFVACHRFVHERAERRFVHHRPRAEQRGLVDGRLFGRTKSDVSRNDEVRRIQKRGGDHA